MFYKSKQHGINPIDAVLCCCTGPTEWGRSVLQGNPDIEEAVPIADDKRVAVVVATVVVTDHDKLSIIPKSD